MPHKDLRHFYVLPITRNIIEKMQHLQRLLTPTKIEQAVEFLVSTYRVPRDAAPDVLEYAARLLRGSTRTYLRPTDRYARDRKICDLRLQGLTAQEIADAVGVSKEVVSKVIFDVRQNGGVHRPDRTIEPLELPESTRGRPLSSAKHGPQLLPFFKQGRTDAEAASKTGLTSMVVSKIRRQLIAAGETVPTAEALADWRSRWDPAVDLVKFAANRLKQARMDQFNATFLDEGVEPLSEEEFDRVVADFAPKIKELEETLNERNAAMQSLEAEGYALGLTSLPGMRNLN